MTTSRILVVSRCQPLYPASNAIIPAVKHEIVRARRQGRPILMTWNNSGLQGQAPPHEELSRLLLGYDLTDTVQMNTMSGTGGPQVVSWCRGHYPSNQQIDLIGTHSDDALFELACSLARAGKSVTLRAHACSSSDGQCGGGFSMLEKVADVFLHPVEIDRRTYRLGVDD